MKLQGAIQLVKNQSTVRESFGVFCAIVIPNEPLLDWQFEDCVAVLENKEYAWVWSRRVGKTRCATLLAVYLAILGLYGAYYASTEKQLEQPRRYFAENPFVTDVKKDWIYVMGHKLIRLNVLTVHNARSGTFDWVIFDEEADIQKQKETAIALAKIQTRNSLTPLVFHLSSAKQGTEFEKNYLRLEKKGLVSRHPYTDVPRAANWIDWDAIEEDRKTYPEWWFNQEYLAKFDIPNGPLFPNAHFGTFEYKESDIRFKVIGVDPGEAFNVVVEVASDGDKMYAIGEETIHNHRNQDGELVMNFDWVNAMYPNHLKAVETGGANTAYAMKAAETCSFTKMIADKGEIAARVANALSHPLYVDPTRTPKLFEDIHEGLWDPLHPMKVLKNKYHRNHFLDAFLIAVSLASQGTFVSIPSSPLIKL